MERTGRKRSAVRMIILLLITAAVIAGVWLGADSTKQRLTQKGLETTQQNLRRGAVACYALEGRYPQSLQYLMDNYNITVDESRYQVSYSIFASNLMPDITVTVK